MAKTKLHTAVDERDESGLRGLLIEGKTNIDAVDANGFTALGRAAANGRVNLMGILMAYNADLNKCGKNGRNPPLHAAVFGDEIAAVRLLVDAGADLELKAIEMHGESTTALWQAADAGSAEILQMLIEAGADVSTADEDQCSALFAATRKGEPAIVQMLVDAGAPVDAASDVGITPLQIAAGRGFLDVVSMLLKAGANVNHVNEYGESTLYKAVFSGDHPLVVARLLECGADVNHAESNGSTPLHRAAWVGAVESARLLLEAGADCNSKTQSGQTPLDQANEQGHVEIFKLMTILHRPR